MRTSIDSSAVRIPTASVAVAQAQHQRRRLRSRAAQDSAQVLAKILQAMLDGMGVNLQRFGMDETEQAPHPSSTPGMSTSHTCAPSRCSSVMAAASAVATSSSSWSKK